MSGAARLRLFYFLYYAGVGVTLPYFSIYLQGLGLSGSELGAVQMVQPLVAAPAGLVWAAVADRLRAANRALIAGSGIVALAYLGLPFARGPLAIAAVMCVVGLGGAALVPLIDAIAVEWSRAQPGQAYARTRLFGSLGYVVFAQGLGLWLAARGDLRGDVLVPLSLLASASGCALVSLTLPRAPPPEHPARLADALALLRERPLLLLLVICALHWMDCAPYHLLFGIFVREHGLPSSLVGLGSGLGVLAEVLVLWTAPALENRFSIRTLFALSFLATVARWALLAGSASAPAIVALQLLHGATFGLFWATAIRALREKVPAQLRVSGYALFSAVVFQLGNAIANPLVGRAYDRVGRVGPLYGWAALVELIPLALLVFVR